MNPKCTGCHKRLKVYFIPAYGYGLFCETVNCPKWRFADRFADSSETVDALKNNLGNPESPASFLKNDLGTPESPVRIPTDRRAGERDLEGRLVDSKESTESASFLKNDLGTPESPVRIPTEGFCYHCIDCEFSNRFSEPAIMHSKLKRHGVMKRFRENCMTHNLNFKHFNNLESDDYFMS